MEGPDWSSSAFYNVVKYGKFAVLGGLLILAFINGHKEYVADNPRKFMWDSFLMGLTSALAIAYVAKTRGRTDLIPNLAFIAFFLFFAYNVVRELSGLNAAATAGEEKLSQGETLQARVLARPLYYTFLTVGGLMFLLAATAHRGHPMGFTPLVMEGLVFGGLAALGEAVIAMNHAETAPEIARATGLTFVFFFVAHLLLQFGGFYDHVFSS